MNLMTSSDKTERPGRHRVLAGHPAPSPSFLIERSKQRNAGGADRSKLLHKVGQRAPRKSSGFHIVVLLKTREWRLIAPGNPQCPVSENSLGIRHMPQYLFDRPFVRRIAE